MNIANFLTILRLVLLPLLIYLMIVEGEGVRIWSGLLFLFMFSTDILDGYLARRLNIVTKLGRILDPLADKLTLITVYIALIYMETIPFLGGGVIVMREILVFLISAIFFLSGKDMIHPTRLGKITAGVLYVGAGINIFQFQTLGILLIWVGGFLAIISALDYIRLALKTMQEVQVD